MEAASRKTALITGASRGIGAATARIFASAGWNVALAARNEEAIANLSAEIGGEQALAIPCEVSRPWEVEATVSATVDAFGGIDALILNAGVIDPIGRMADIDPEDWGRVIDVNLKAVFYGIHAVLPIMLEAGGGTILTVSSGAASKALEGWSHYCSSKAGAAMVMRCLDTEYRGHGIRAMGLSPGTVDTDMQVSIKDSALNPVSRLERSDHIHPDWPARALLWMTGGEADDLVGSELSLRDEATRRRIGLAD